MPFDDILTMVCAHMDSVQQLALLCKTNKALKTYLYSEEGGNLWLKIAQRICGGIWSGTDHVKDGRYEAMVRLCPWLGEKKVEPISSDGVSHFFEESVCSSSFRCVREYARYVMSHPAFSESIKLMLPDVRYFYVSGAHFVHAGIVSVVLADGGCKDDYRPGGSIAFFATRDFRLLKVMYRVMQWHQEMQFSCGEMKFISLGYDEIVTYAPSPLRSVAVVQDKNEPFFSAISKSLKVNFYPCGLQRDPLFDSDDEDGYYKIEPNEAWELFKYSSRPFRWNIEMWPGIDAYFGHFEEAGEELVQLMRRTRDRERSLQSLKTRLQYLMLIINNPDYAF